MGHSLHQSYPGGETGTGDVGAGPHLPDGYPGTIVATFRALEFATVVAEEHGHNSHDGDQPCDHAVHVLQALAGGAVGRHINDAVATEGMTFDRIRRDLHHAGMTERDVMSALTIYADWQEAQP